MDLQTTHIAGKLDALGSSRRTRCAKESVEYAHMRFSSLHNDNLKIMEEVVVGNLLDPYISPGSEGDFYFVRFSNQIYLVGLKIQSYKMFDQELFLAVLPAKEQDILLRVRKIELRLKSNEVISILIKLVLIMRMVCIALLSMLIFLPIVMIILPVWLSCLFLCLLIQVFLNKVIERMLKKTQKLDSEFKWSQDLFSKEMMNRIME